MAIHIKKTLTIKDDHKVRMAYRQGLIHGIMLKTCGLQAGTVYRTMKENRAYRYAVQAVNGDYISLYQAGCRELDLLEMAINKCAIINIGWRITRCRESEFRPFIE